MIYVQIMNRWEKKSKVSFDTLQGLQGTNISQ